MKKIVFCVLSLFTLSILEVIGQCNAEAYSNQCIPKLAAGFNFLKSYKIEKGSKDFVEYSYVFTKGTQYMINICSEGEGTDGIVVSLFDSNRNKVATSKVNGQYISAIAYPCNTTGIYYIQYTFDGSSTNCGGSALGFKR
ncbi:MAG: hypothetical protein DIU61_001380 [Bacteroidota bacterium]|jgi:hypothetical protein|nr:MAG: hypothetical protein DIU61_02285 [Bacteroidota bacterium]